MKRLLLAGALFVGILSFDHSHLTLLDSQNGEKVAVYVAPGPLIIEDQKV